MTNYEDFYYRPPYQYTELEPKTDWLGESLQKRPLEKRDPTLVSQGEKMAGRSRSM